MVAFSVTFKRLGPYERKANISEETSAQSRSPGPTIHALSQISVQISRDGTLTISEPIIEMDDARTFQRGDDRQQNVWQVCRGLELSSITSR